MKERNLINRELSWLEFNHRVLEEALDKNNPLFERLKFLTIVSSNLDEFFMVRVASIRDRIHAKFKKKDSSGLSPKEEISKISLRTHRMVSELYHCYQHSLKRGLRKEKILLLDQKDLNLEQKSFIKNYFENNIFPVLTPMVVDNTRPFPLVLNKSLNIALLVEDPQDRHNFYFATVQVPSVLERLVEVPSAEDTKSFILLEEIIKNKLDKIFVGYKILAKANYRITRNADLSLDEEGAEDLLAAIEQSLRQRKWGSVIRLEIEKDVEEQLLKRLLSELEINEDEVFRISGPIDLIFLQRIASLEEYPHLLNSPREPLPSKAFQDNEDLFEAIRQNDIMLHHPYHSFLPVIKLVQQAAADPQVLAIKQTLYRVSGNSPIVEALVHAAENGKQVTVLVEIKARFDEQNNIHWAKRLETAGCHVIYGLSGLKTHCKVLLIVRREDDGIKRYVHMSTGNYNDVTARFYTDIGLFTANPYFGADASNLFNMLSGLSQPLDMYRLCLAPSDLRKKILKLIQRETVNAEQGKKAAIIVKINSLVDQEMIESLYDASCAGVKIELIVRGICCLKPGIPEVSSNIMVSSIVSRFLEHSRIYYFYNGGSEEIFLSSADLMERNLDRRIEVMFPIDDQKIKEEVKRILDITLKDTAKAKKLSPDGTYKRKNAQRKEAVNSQEVFYQEVFQEASMQERLSAIPEFRPILTAKEI